MNSLTISLEPHLAQSLSILLPFLPSDLSSTLSEELKLTEIHYTLLTQISRWARTDPGKAKLHEAHLEPREYDNIVSLLAGTRTAPSSKPPPDAPPGSDSPEARARRDRNDKKALVAVLNGLLSVGCAGGAAWWAADKSGWRDEWKVLLGLLVAAVVALSEIVLFIIWQSRSSSSSTRPRVLKSSHKKSDDNGESPESPPTHNTNTTIDVPDTDAPLRRRTARATEN